MGHELAYASANGMLGSVDAKSRRPPPRLGHRPVPHGPVFTAQVMLIVLGQGGLAPGGLNFDAKVRRESFEPVDLFHRSTSARWTVSRKD